MFTLFPLHSHTCQLHTLLPTLQIKFQLLFPWLQHSSLPSDPACCFSLLSYLALIQIQPTFESLFIGIPKHSEKPCYVSTTLEHWTLRLQEELNWWCWSFHQITLQLACPVMPINLKTWTSFTNALVSFWDQTIFCQKWNANFIQYF